MWNTWRLKQCTMCLKKIFRQWKKTEACSKKTINLQLLNDVGWHSLLQNAMIVLRFHCTRHWFGCRPRTELRPQICCLLIVIFVAYFFPKSSFLPEFSVTPQFLLRAPPTLFCSCLSSAQVCSLLLLALTVFRSFLVVTFLLSQIHRYSSFPVSLPVFGHLRFVATSAFAFLVL